MTDKNYQKYKGGVSHLRHIVPPESMDTGKNKSYSMKNEKPMVL